MKKVLTQIFSRYSAGDDCPQCHKGILRDTGRTHHGDRILCCTTCQWEVRENTKI